MSPILLIAAVVVILLLLLLVGAKFKPIRFLGMSVVRVIIGALLLFALNMVGTSINLHIPINVVTASICGFLGLPGLGALAVIQLYILA